MNRRELIWSPKKPDRFVTVGVKDLSLYAIIPSKRKDAPSSAPGSASATTSAYSIDADVPEVSVFPSGPASFVERLSMNKHTFTRVVAWNPHPDWDHIFAVGHTGRVLLCSPSSSTDLMDDPARLRGLEFQTRRFCNHVVWNTVKPNLLAICLEKYRNEPSIRIWDVYQGSGISGVPVRNSRDLCPSDSAVSADWVPGSGDMLLAGVSRSKQGHIRLFDTRDPQAHKLQLQTTAIHGVAVDPTFSQRACSFSDNELFWWDCRRLKNAVSIAQAGSIIKVAWCPTRSGMLGVLVRNSDRVRVYQTISQRDMDTDDIETNERMRRHICPTFATPYSHAQYEHATSLDSFAWHISDPCRAMCLSSSGAFCDTRLTDLIPLSIGRPTSSLAFSIKNVICQTTMKDCGRPVKDDDELSIADLMKRRAEAGYSTKIRNTPDLFENKELFPPGQTESEDIRAIWKWMHDVKQIIQVDVERLKQINSQQPSRWHQHETRYPGVAEVLSKAVSDTNDQIRLLTENIPVQFYYSADRDAILKLCGWGSVAVGDREVLDSMLTRLREERQFERAAAIELITLSLDRAIKVLSLSESELCQLAALALSGLQNSPTIWQDSCRSLLPRLQSNPYLRILFKFMRAVLLQSALDVQAVFDDDGWILEDRIAFSTLYFPRDALSHGRDLRNDLLALKDRLLIEGRLRGLILTGVLSEDGISLLHNYVTRTGDVQTAALICIQSRHADLADETSRVRALVDTYIGFLNAWNLLHCRYICETALQQALNKGPENKLRKSATKGTFPCCIFCHHPLHTPGYATRPGVQRSRSSACPTCKRPKPRCAVCLANIGPMPAPGNVDNKSQLDVLGDWLTWCQTCRHGGHASHLKQWFQEQDECPVSGCTCHCMSASRAAPDLHKVSGLRVQTL